MLRVILCYVVGLREPLRDAMSACLALASLSRLLELAHDIG